MGIPSPFSFLACFECYVGILEAKTLIGHCILFKKDMNMKIGGVIHGYIALLLAIISLDSKLTCGFYECLSE